MGYYSAAPPNEPKLIFYLEALCVLSALDFCCQRLSPRRKLVNYTDNQNTIDIFSSLKCLPTFSCLLQTSITLRVMADIDLRVLHNAGDDNEVADALSRADFHRAISLSPNLILNFFTPYHLNKPLQPPQSSLGANQK